MYQPSNRACLAQGKDTYASSSLGFRDERLLKLEQIQEHTVPDGRCAYQIF